LSLGVAVLYLSLIVLIPLVAVAWRAGGMGWRMYVDLITQDDVVAALWVSFFGALVAAAVNVVFGLLVAWVFVRYAFPGKRVLDAVIDLPFALPTAVAGIALSAVYAENGWIGHWFADGGLHLPWLSWWGWTDGFHPSSATWWAAGGYWPLELQWFDHIAFTPIGLLVALMFIGLPFVVRTLQPVLADMTKETEEASASLGATRWQTFRRVIFPEIWPALLTGFALAFARGVGEYGSVIFITAKMPFVDEIAPLKIIQRLNDYDYAGATSIGVTMLAMSFVLLLVINLLQRWLASRSAA
jgi:sulfate transport system permease protein